jgi:hypothetical protein
VNVLLAFIWIATGAVVLGIATGARRDGLAPSRAPLAWSVAIVAGVVCCFWMAFEVTAVAPTVDTIGHPGDVTCGSAWGQLHPSPQVETSAGPEFDPAAGPCEAAAWHRVAVLGASETGLAALVGAVMLIQRPRVAAPEDDVKQSSFGWDSTDRSST